MATIKDIHGNIQTTSSNDVHSASLGMSLEQAIKNRQLPIPIETEEQIKSLHTAIQKILDEDGRIEDLSVEYTTDETGVPSVSADFTNGKLSFTFKNLNGTDGKSAYDIAVENGFVGTKEEWLASLKGDKGVRIENLSVEYTTNETGVPSVSADFTNGKLSFTFRNLNGTDGKSAYDIAVDEGFVGTKEEWLASLNGQDGRDGILDNVVQTIDPSDTVNVPSSAAVAEFVAEHAGQGSGDGTHPYSGERIQAKIYRYSYQLLMTESNSSSSSNQGAACYGKYLFQCHNTNDVIDIFNLDTKTLIQSITLVKNSKYHCNNANFGVEFASATDDFPLLYVSQEHADSHICLVYRISGTEGSWGATLVQTITFPIPSDDFLWYPNSLIDTQNKKLIVAGLGNNPWSKNTDNIIRYKIFALPLLAEGNVTLDIANIEDSIEVKYYSTCQGGFVLNNKIYGVFGMKNNAQLNVIDLDTHKVISKVDITGDVIVDEPEGCFIYDNKICVNFISGKIYQFNF